MSPSSSFQPVTFHCSNVPVLYELLKGEEKHSRVWLRDEMNQIPDPLIDSLFHGLIMSSSSSSVVPQNRLTVSKLCQQLEGEKVQLRWVLRSEMDRLVNTLFEKLTNKLKTNTNLDRSEDGGDRELLENHLDKIELQSHQPSSHIAQPSTSSPFNHDSHQQHSNGNEPEFDHILAEVKQEIVDEENEMELENVMDNKATQVSNEQIEQDCVKQEVKEEFEDGEMLLIEEEEDENGEESRFAENTSIETIQFDPTGDQSQVIVTQSVKRKQHNEESNQVQNEMVNRESEEDNVQVEDDDAGEGTSRSVKRPRIPSRPTISSSSTEEKQIITHTLQCPQSGCELMFAKDQFSTHLWDRHSIRPHRCLVKDCGHHSFDNHLILSEHLAQCHQSTTQWHCDKCLKHFSTYPSLSMHNINYHQIGHFQCSFPACTFTGEYKMKVYCHYIQQHKKTEFNCHHSECSYVAPNVPNLKQHLQSHLEPYRCKWTECHFASGTRVTTLAHIRSVHLKKCAKTYSKVSAQSPLIDPNDYLEVIQFK